MAQLRRWTGSTLKDVPAADFITKYAEHLKRSGRVVLPAWVDIVKTAPFKELAPYDPDWFYVRMASIARKLYIRSGLGIGALRRQYGGIKNNGVAPSHFAKAAGGVIRACLQQLEAIKVIEKCPNGKGRRVTRQGQRDMDRIAGNINVAPRAV
eukprot:TRINITY_DN201_c0_g1_i2.p1 TRINITY_DN201_c0_g1~~TRINITY_DN201_c0_g1_i2.p1  ORF type:complete len:153 (+),score=29.71 TRINITY_DN201_c0_g1_i2:106-564(+)